MKRRLSPATYAKRIETANPDLLLSPYTDAGTIPNLKLRSRKGLVKAHLNIDDRVIAALSKTKPLIVC